MVALDREAEVDQSPMACRLLGRGAERVHLREGPHDELSTVPDALKREARGPRDTLVQEDRRAAAGLADQLRATAVRGDERCLGRGERNVVVALRVDAVDAKWPGDADRYLDCADKVL